MRVLALRETPRHRVPCAGRPGAGKGRVQFDESTTDLVRAAATGDQGAWDRLVARYENLLWSVARGYRLGTADAGDVVQTSWLKLLENLDRIEDPERLAGWLATTARRECLRVLRRSGREVLDDDAVADVVDNAPALDTALIEQERDVALWQAFAKLPERCQRLLRILMGTEPMAYAEVAEALEMPIGAIGPTRGRCLAKLRDFAVADGDLVGGVAS